jgi:DNA-binding transcriptional LysR family regulator
MSQWQSLSVFLAVAEEGSFSGAAKKLEITQPTVSFHIDNLEKKLGCPLVERTAKGTTLTVYGEVLFANLGKAEALLKVAENQLNSMVKGAAGRITLGASTVPAEYILPGLAAEFLQKNPGLEIDLRTGDSMTIIEAFSAGQFPIAVVGSPPGDGVKSRPLWQDELVMVAHPALADRLGNAPSLEEALSLPLISRGQSSGSMRAVENALAVRGIGRDRLRVVLQVGGNEALKAAIASQAGAGFISRWAVREELSAGRLAVIPLTEVRIFRTFYAICRQPLLPTCLQMFWDYLLASPAKPE